MAAKVYLREVGLRDGLQLAKLFLPTERKIEWLIAEAATGVKAFEVTSFVPPKVVPQFADAAAVSRDALPIPELDISALIPNVKGAELGIAAGVTRLNFVLSASEEHNLANVRRSTRDSIADFARLNDLRAAHAGVKLVLAGGIATAFGCTISGTVDEGRVTAIAAELIGLGADQLIIADTVGYATPRQVKRLLSNIVREAGGRQVIAHFHDTRGTGLANVVAALEAGVTGFDASLGGLGGCPFAPGATGNINMEDTAYLLESMGLDTGIDIDALIALRTRVEPWLPQERFTGGLARAGLPKNFSSARA
jgi:hydroxymethylglutaryl-CoA lyase